MLDYKPKNEDEAITDMGFATFTNPQLGWCPVCAGFGRVFTDDGLLPCARGEETGHGRMWPDLWRNWGKT